MGDADPTDVTETGIETNFVERVFLVVAGELQESGWPEQYIVEDGSNAKCQHHVLQEC